MSAVTRHTGVDLAVEHVLNTLRDRIVPRRAGPEHPKTALHHVVDELDGCAAELLAA